MYFKVHSIIMYFVSHTSATHMILYRQRERGGGGREEEREGGRKKGRKGGREDRC